MADDIRAMSAELAGDPASMVFLRLGEALRARGQAEAATKVVLAGLERHADSAEAHDLYARILADGGDLDGAEREWNAVLGMDPRHLGAHKGLGFLCFRRGNLDAALDHLEVALSVDPTDQSVVQALRIVRGFGEPAPSAPAASAPTAPPPRIGALTWVDEAEHSLLLVDHRGLVLGGDLKAPGGGEVADAVAAQLAGVAQEAERTTRMLELGAWSSITAEAAGGNLFLTQPAPDAVLLLLRDRSVPAGRLAVLAERAAAAARTWLTGQAP